MDDGQRTSRFDRPAEVDLTDFSRTAQVEMARNVAELLDHQGFKNLCEVLEVAWERVLDNAILQPPRPDGAGYAYSMGQVRGLQEPKQLALGIVENGELVAEQLAKGEEQ